jgi:hypothetical protein
VLSTIANAGTGTDTGGAGPEADDLRGVGTVARGGRAFPPSADAARAVGRRFRWVSGWNTYHSWGITENCQRARVTCSRNSRNKVRAFCLKPNQQHSRHVLADATSPVDGATGFGTGFGTDGAAAGSTRVRFRVCMFWGDTLLPLVGLFSNG